MSKMKNQKSKTLVLISKNVNKKGKIKGGSKKETKQLKLMCPHHRITKKGSVKPTIVPVGKNEEGKTISVCELCKKEIVTSFYTDEEIHEATEKMEDILQQLKFMGTAIGSGKVTDFAAQAMVFVHGVPKGYIRSRNISRKSGNIKKKKKEAERGSAVYGSWSIKK